MKTILSLLVAIIACLVSARPFLLDSQSTNSPMDQTTSSTTTSSSSNKGGQVIVDYFDTTTPAYFSYGTCILFRNPDHMIKSFQVTTLATCYTYLDQNCKINQEPLPLPATPLLKVLNPANLAPVLIEAFLCLDFSESSAGQHLQDTTMVGPMQHVGMGLTPPKANQDTHHHMNM